MGFLDFLGDVLQAVEDNLSDAEEMFRELDNYDLCEKVSTLKESNYTMLGAGVGVLKKRAGSMSRKELYNLFMEFGDYGNGMAASTLYGEMNRRGMVDDDDD